MLELNIFKNNNPESQAYGKYYARVVLSASPLHSEYPLPIL